MRVTESMMLNSALASEARAASNMAVLSEQATSGLRVEVPSDDPAAYASLVQQSQQIATVQARSAAASQASSDLDLASNALDQATNVLSQARALAVQGSDGGWSDDARNDAAAAVDSLRQELIGLANTRGSTGYLFGGTKTATPPFDSSGQFSGNDSTTEIEIAQGVKVPSNADGATAFTAAGGLDVFTALANLSAALHSNNLSAMPSCLNAIDAAHTQVVAAEVSTGQRSSSLKSATDVMNSTLTALQIAKGNMADADAPTTLSQLQATQTAYQEALAVNKNILSMAYSSSGT
ncbi:MAG: flagellar hook-associated protein FlgL [Polyangiaceae bacterium]|jgi:flagellar hook-associated protein 3 FlgL